MFISAATAHKTQSVDIKHSASGLIMRLSVPPLNLTLSLFYIMNYLPSPHPQISFQHPSDLQIHCQLCSESCWEALVSTPFVWSLIVQDKPSHLYEFNVI